MVVSKYTEEEEEDVEIEASSLITRKRSKKAIADTSSDPQTDGESVAAESLQVQESQQAQEAFIIEQGKSVARELRTSVAHHVEKKTVEDA